MLPDQLAWRDAPAGPSSTWVTVDLYPSGSEGRI